MKALDLVNKQAEDEGLWFDGFFATEAYLQRALRDLHQAVEQDAKELIRKDEVIELLQNHALHIEFYDKLMYKLEKL